MAKAKQKEEIDLKKAQLAFEKQKLKKVVLRFGYEALLYI